MEKYTLGRLLGSGADGKVFYALRIADQYPVCIKQIHNDQGVYQKESGHNETKAYQKLSHPNIPVYYEHFTTKNVLNIVIEWSDGDLLRNVMYYHKTKKIPFPEPYILKVFAQMVSVLRYLKSLRILYCDVKPDNIMIDSHGDIKLIDFGTAREANSKLKKAFSFGGTLAYMSPEMLGDGGYSFETDVWSLGALIYEMMTHTFPFGCKPQKEVVRKVQSGELPEIKTDYSPALKNAVKMMLRKKPGARITIEKLSQLDFLPEVPTEITPRQINHLGAKHKFGLGVPQNHAEAARLFKLSADKGSTTGMFNYCFSVLNGDKRAEGLAYLKQAADIGNTDAIYNYALSLEQGWGGPPDLAGAVPYYKRSADEGNIESMCTYAIACTEGWSGETDIDKAVEYYRLAAESGSPFGMLNYANALAGGLAGPVDQEGALKWYKLAADGGDPGAMFNYGAGLSHGWGGNTNLPEAMKYFKMAADNGNVSGLYNYGLALEYGYDGNSDLNKAVKYYQLAAEKGSEPAKEAYFRLAESRLPNIHEKPRPASGQTA
jgi:TPR repeat protein/tRNA A-37 threonylcarbamoyl transferase component Bud32